MSEAILARNVKAIARVLRSLKLTAAVVEYEGGGDSGETTSILVINSRMDADISGKTADRKVRLRVREWKTKDGYKMAYLRLEDALECLCDAAIDVYGHRGYENNEGGNGKWTIYATSTATLDHYDFYTESVNDVHVLGEAA